MSHEHASCCLEDRLFRQVAMTPPPASDGDTWEQFEEGPSTSPGAVELATVEVVPNPAPAGSMVLVTVTLTGPAPADTSIALSFGDAQVPETIEIAAGASSGSLELELPAQVPTGNINVTARLGTSEVTTVLGIEGAGVADVSEVGAVPNPVAPGETLVITVTAATPPPQRAAVELLIDGEPFGTIL